MYKQEANTELHTHDTLRLGRFTATYLHITAKYCY